MWLQIKLNQMEHQFFQHQLQLMVLQISQLQLCLCIWWCRTRKYPIYKIKCTSRLCISRSCSYNKRLRGICKKLFPTTQSVSVWGGEDGSYDSSTGVSSTPEYGKVFISIKSTTGVDLTSAQKTNLEIALAPYKVASITPVVVDAETTSIILGITIMYDSSATTYTLLIRLHL